MKENDSDGIKVLVDDYRQGAYEKDWDDVRYLSDEEIALMAVSPESFGHTEKDTMESNLELQLVLDDLKSKIENLQQEIDFLTMALTDTRRHYTQIAEFRSDLIYASRKIELYRQQYDVALCEYYGQSR